MSAPQPPRFRLASMSRATTPAAAPPPAPETVADPPRAPLFRPPFRPFAQPTPTTGNSSVPSSPIARPATVFSSVPPSPAPRPTETTTTTTSLPSSPVRVPTGTTATSLPPSPKPAISASPAPKPIPTTSSVPSSPIPNPIPTSTISSVPSSPARNEVNSASTFMQSPRTFKPTVQTPSQSPKPNPTAPPPSPLTLPPSQIKHSSPKPETKIPLELEQKNVLVQNVDKSPIGWMNGTESKKEFTNSLHSSIANLATKEPSKDWETKEKMKLVSRKKGASSGADHSDHESGTRVIRLAGENTGAHMQLIQSLNKKDSTFLPKIGNQEWSDREGKAKKNGQNFKGMRNGVGSTSSFINSNVQGINSSIMYNSSCSHHGPGVHLTLSRKAKDSNKGYHY